MRQISTANELVELLHDKAHHDVYQPDKSSDDQTCDRDDYGGFAQLLSSWPGDFAHLLGNVIEVILDACDHWQCSVMNVINAGVAGLEPTTRGFGDRCSTI
jgi:hypothetical protein